MHPGTRLTVDARVPQTSERRARLAAIAFLTPVVIAVVWLLVSGKTYVSSGVVRVEPVWVAALAPDGPLTGSAADARQEQLRAAREDLEARIGDALRQSYRYAVEPVGDDEFRFEVRSGGAEDATGAAVAVTAAFVGARTDVGAVQQAIVDAQFNVDAADAQLALPENAGDPGLLAERAALLERLRQYQADAAIVTPDLAQVTQAPESPTEPESPDFVRVLAAAAAFGLVLACLAWWITGRRADRGGASEDGSDRAERRTATPLTVVVAISAALLVAAGIAGLHAVWEQRPALGSQTGPFYECVDDWLASLPEGSSIYPEGDAFWVINLSVAAHPRLRVAPSAEAADYRLRVLLEYDAAPGEQRCEGYKIAVFPA